MKKGKRKHKLGNRDKDLDKMERYDVSESEDGLDDEEKIMLDRAKQGRYIQDEREEEVLPVYESSDGSEDESDHNYYGGGLGSDYDSDLDKGKEDDGLPSSLAWGSKKSKYYQTDYVDQDYGGFGKEEEEAALMEEEEAKAIQRRLMQGLEDNDFTMGLFDKVEEKKMELSQKAETSQEAEKIQTDLSKLSKEEKVQFLNQESPELFPLIEDFKDRMKFIEEKIQPMLRLAEMHQLPDCKALECLQLLNQIILNYCTNITFYLLLKSKRLPVDNHPVVQRLLAGRKLLAELDRVYQGPLAAQVDAILQGAAPGVVDQVKAPEKANRAERRKKKLKILEEKKIMEEEIERKKKKLEGLENEKIKPNDLFMSEDESETGDESDESETRQDKKLRIVEQKEQGEEGESSSEDEEAEKEGKEEASEAKEKRSITYKMAKNKGLTARKRKELKNPRVKHRNKFKKAKVRRKGQVREVRKELEKYGGELSGIKANINKSIKLK